MASDEMLSWLKATIEGDRAAAEANGDETWTAHDEGAGDNWTIVIDDQGSKQGDSCGCCCRGTLDEVAAKHMAIHDPRDTIARCEAELALLDDYAEAKTFYDQHLSAPAGELYGLGSALKRLASGYRNREGFRPEWVANLAEREQG